VKRKFSTAYTAAMYLDIEPGTPFEVTLDVHHEALPGGVFGLYLTPEQAMELGEALIMEGAIQKAKKARWMK
jgi:hypothetical protein